MKIIPIKPSRVGPWLVTILTLLVCSGAAMCAEPVLLGYRFIPGETMVYRMVIRGTSTSTSGTIKEKSHIETVLRLTQRVAAVNQDGIARLECRIDSGKSTVNGQEFTPLNVGQKFNVQLNEQGEVISVQGLAEGINIDQMQITFPAQPVSLGDSWKREFTVTSGYPVKLMITYTVEDITRTEASCLVKLRSVVEGIPQEAPRPGVLLNKLRAEGSILFDCVKGRITSNHVSSVMQMKMREIKDGAPRDVSTRLNMSMTVELQ